MRRKAVAGGMVLVAWLSCLPAQAQTAAGPAAGSMASGAAKVDPESWKRMTPEARNAERERLRSQWQQMTPAERQAVR